MSNNEQNRQVRKTRAALLSAFRDLVLTRRYESIRISEIIRRADVGRSTFYEHFRNKDDLLRASVADPLTHLAESVRASCELARIQFILEHFRENHQLARGMLDGPSSPEIIRVLAELIEERLQSESKAKPMLAPGLIATQIAHAQLGLVRAWLHRWEGCSAEELALALHKSGRAMVASLFPEGPGPAQN